MTMTGELMPRPTLAELETDMREKWAAFRAHDGSRGFDSAKEHARLETLANEALELWNLTREVFEQ